MTLTAPQRSKVDLRAERVVVWSPPKVTIRGVEYSVEFALRPDTIYHLSERRQYRIPCPVQTYLVRSV